MMHMKDVKQRTAFSVVRRLLMSLRMVIVGKWGGGGWRSITECSGILGEMGDGGVHCKRSVFQLT